MSVFSRQNPSPRYLEMQKMYQMMHINGDETKEIPAEQMFDGRSLVPHLEAVNNILRSYHCSSLLDYGCGKALAYEIFPIKTSDGKSITGFKNLWHDIDIHLYDPGYAPYSQLPEGKYDAVISTDALEHITKEDIPWVIEEILGFAIKVVYLNIACYPARKILPNGENAHITQESPGWWIDLIHDIKRAKFDYLKVILAIDDRDYKRVTTKF